MYLLTVVNGRIAFTEWLFEVASFSGDWRDGYETLSLSVHLSDEQHFQCALLLCRLLGLYAAVSDTLRSTI